MRGSPTGASMVFAALLSAAGCGSGTLMPTAVKSEWADGRYHLSIEGVGQFHATPNSIEQARLVRVPESPVLLALWKEKAGRATTSHYAISLDGREMAVARQTDPELKLRYRSFDPLVESPPPAELPATFGNVYFVQFETQPLPIFIEQLRRAGAKPYRYFPNNAYLVFMSPEVRQRIAELPYVRWVGPYEWYYRLEEGLLPSVLAGEATHRGRFNIEVFERGLAQQNSIKQLVEGLGGSVEKTTPQGLFLEATLDLRLLAKVTQADEVVFVDRWSAPEPDMDIVREIGGADYVEQVGGFTGAGVRGEVLDVGVRATHVDFDGTLIPHGRQNEDYHGTSTTGIVFGKGIGNPRARGLLPDGQGITAFSAALTNRYQHTLELLADPYFAVFQTNSWGGGLTLQYTTTSAEMDDILFQTGVLITQSQSNARSRLSRPEAWAKNIVSVGGINHYRSLDMDTHCWCGDASIGPASDGRIKPDLAHFYDQIFTTTGGSDAAYTESFGGTSAATPITAGHFGLFFQMWHLGIFGNPTAETVFDSRPHMATAKAVMINTARQWSFSGTEHDRTRTHQGWGMVDVRNLYDQSAGIFIVNETDILQNLERKTYNLEVPADTPQLKATLAYKDPSGLPSSTVQRINDLSLRVVSPSGVEYWGNYGLLSEMWSASDGEEDHINTVENVFVPLPEPGIWTVEVIATEIVEDSHPETPEIDADYALVVSGVIRP